ncbi:MAG TPA: leucine--tRNA ligase [Anaerolineae bacterium]|nr:leucine--tRNA ligase [Anaerolineae bacterium]
MTDKYNPRKIEAKWQKRWEETQLYHVNDDVKKPYFFLTMLPYPSGDLHIGHWFAYTPSDARARYMRMKGHDVMFPIGFDAFGLPAENAAIKRGAHPHEWTIKNIERMRGQLRSMGAMWDWQREVVTCQPEYYRWSQWFFLQFYKHGLAYRSRSAVDWCPQCNTTLAREQVWGEDRHCERCGTPVVKKDLAQWYLRITKYAEELLHHDGLNWPERVITMQRNWIGKSEGAELIFKSEQGDDITVFTTRPDTVYGATFMVLAPEHPLVARLTSPEQRAAVEAYVADAARQTEIARLSAEKEKTGVFSGAYAVNPATGVPVPIWIADYVLMGYGSGAIMAVPAHDERDFDFARKYDLPIRVVIAPPTPSPCEGEGRGEGERRQARSRVDQCADPLTLALSPEGEREHAWSLAAAYTGEGPMVNSGPFDGMGSAEGIKAVTAFLAEKGLGKPAVSYRLRDWLISRQRYWGTPIPIVYCERCGTVPVPEEQLPVLLPSDAEFLPTGESPLRYHEGFRQTTCPQCGGPAERETDTMDTFVCSSWYQMRYTSPHYDQGPFDPQAAKTWLPVQQYTGGIEHACMHLLYTRFFAKALRDMGLLDHGEPMLNLFNQGIVLGEDNEKMSKSRGNVVNPDDYVSALGADAVRAYIMFIGPWELGGSWNSRSIEGISRFLNKVWGLVTEALPSPPRGEGQGVRGEALHKGSPSPHPSPSEGEGVGAGSPRPEVAELRRYTHKTIRTCSEHIEHFRFNVYLAALMEYTNHLLRFRETAAAGTPAWREATHTLALLLAPITPHLAEELWARLGEPYSVHQQPWPAWREDLAADEVITLIVQINGKVRARLEVPAEISEADAKALAVASDGAKRHIDGKTIKDVIYVPGKLVNIVVR